MFLALLSDALSELEMEAKESEAAESETKICEEVNEHNAQHHVLEAINELGFVFVYRSTT